MGINTIDLNNINLHDNNFDNDIESIIHAKLCLGVININNGRHLKKS